MPSKGLTYSVVVIILVTLAAGVLLLLFMKGFFDTAKGSIDKVLCQQSVTRKAQLNTLPVIKYASLDKYVPLDCKTNTINLDSKKGIDETIANEMFDCWDQFLEGKVDFLTQFELGGSSPFCFVCSKIDFDKSINQEKIDLSKYLNENDIPEKSGVKYINYFSSTQNSKLNTSAIIQADKPVYVVFLATKETSIWNTFKGSAIGSAVVGLAGCVGVPIVVASVAGPIGAAVFIYTCPGGIGLGIVGGGLAGSSVKENYYPSMIVTNSAKDIVQECNK